MAKISSYGTKIPPALTDMMIGTDTTSSPPNLTKNFTVEELKSLITDGTLYARKKIVPATVQNLFTTPTVLIDAPDVGKAIWVRGVVWSVNPGGSGAWAFPAPTNLFLRYTGSVNQLTVNLTEVYINSATTRAYNLPPLDLIMDNNALLDNTSVELTTTNNAPAQGGEMYVGVVYKIIDLPQLIVET